LNVIGCKNARYQSRNSADLNGTDYPLSEDVVIIN